MANKFRVIRPAPKPEIRYALPIEALHLCEDITRLEMMIELLKTLDESNITKDRERGELDLRSTLVLLRAWHRYAKYKMRREFLAP